MKTGKGWGGEQKGTQLWQARQKKANENIAETQSKGPYNKAHKCEPHRWPP